MYNDLNDVMFRGLLMVQKNIRWLQRWLELDGYLMPFLLFFSAGAITHFFIGRDLSLKGLLRELLLTAVLTLALFEVRAVWFYHSRKHT